MRYLVCRCNRLLASLWTISLISPSLTPPIPRSLYQIKASLFVMSMLALDVQTQQQGFVMITKPSAKASSKRSSFWNSDGMEFQRLAECLPVRCTADHVWMSGATTILRGECDNGVIRPVARGWVPFLGNQASLRVHSTATGQC